MRTPGRRGGRWPGGSWAAQDRDAFDLLLNAGAGAGFGLLFWLLLARGADHPPSDVGLGYAVVALGTAVGLLAKGGLDTALIRRVPGASRAAARRLLRVAGAFGVCLAAFLSIALAAASSATHAFLGMGPAAWLLVGAIGCLLVVTWLQDAYFVAEGRARLTLLRNLAFGAARLVLLAAVLAASLPHAAASAWALGLAASGLLGVALVGSLPARDGGAPSAGDLLRGALRNLSGGAAEFLPGLLLVPLVLAVDGPASAAYFGMAWTVASLLFLASAAIGRSALAAMARDPAAVAAATRRALRQHLLLLAPAAAAVAVASGPLLSAFGPDYAEAGALPLALLALSLVAVAPYSMYLAVARAREQVAPLALLPALLLAGLAAWTPPLEHRLGLPGVALAWLLANAPVGAYATWRLARAAGAREVNRPAAGPVGGAPHLE